MEAEIKRVAQFVLDNAKAIAKVLKQHPQYYRAFELRFNALKGASSPNQIDTQISLYDETTTHYYLYGEKITTEIFKSLCKQMNKESKGRK